MDWLDAVIMGLVQGLTEFLPVSSSAHLRFVGSLIGSEDPGAAFTAITQLGTETAVLIYFWKDIVRILKSWWLAMPWIPATSRIPQSNPDTRMGWMIIVGSIPIGILGLTLEDWIDTSFRNLWITVFTLAIFGVLLGWADSVGAKKKELTQLSWRDAIIYGFAQAMALIPGVSRSGGTITAGRLMGYTRKSAARYSFLLALPAVFISGLYKVYKVATGGDTIYVGPTVLATIVAFGVGYLVIVWFLRLISTHSFMPFVWYRLGFAALIAICLFFGIVPAMGGVSG
ncbi:undecaprenyl-diphosphate phosphatase [Actinomycetaceae bacterium WB03_NA08]|uniref:Undecaprenyl-diphosphatase n=1 Tax=Scrofimicrobium canadense TaxID=2652290 RepID=A0A6N7VQH8_9ACTO|nr:undecaprenyl-diphosphate phosphatase [Scrofimicrobium canadense]MSS84009.1 undecaprenyl-diphosphate phosphatase [Scrofimicrobium canadense]